MLKKRSNIKLLLILVFMVVSLLLLTTNIFALTVLKTHLRSDTDLEVYSESISYETKTLKAKRGTIYDSKGNILAYDIEKYKIIAHLDKERFGINNIPAHVVDINATATALSPILNISIEDLVFYLSQDYKQVELGVNGTDLSLETKEAILELELPGIEFVTIAGRNYPNGVFASQLIGFAQYDVEENNIIGKSGLENYLNDYLTGTDGSTTFSSSRSGIVLPGSSVETNEAIDGSDVYLTINPDIQKELDDILAQKASENTSDRNKIWSTIMEVETGKIIAMSEYPTFNPNILDIKNYENMNTQMIYEPGSTMKTFLYAAAIDSGNYVGSKTFDSSSYKMNFVNGKAVRTYGDSYEAKIDNYGGYSWGDITFDYGYMRSSNVGIAELLTNYISPETYRDYLDDFGFFKSTEMLGVAENTGWIQYTYPLEKITAGFGQGMFMNTLQLMQAYSAIFNDGVMMRPYYVEEIKNASTGEVEYVGSPTVAGNPITETTAKEVQNLMKELVIQTNSIYKMEEMDLLLKTGTSQLYIDGEYSNHEVIHSVMMGFPAEDPKIMLYFAFEAIDQSAYLRNSEHVKNIVRKVASVYDLEGQEIEVKNHVNNIKVQEMPSFINKSITGIKNELNNLDMEVIYIGDGDRVIDQFPATGENVVTGQRIFLKTNDKNITMPEMLGWSRKDVTVFWSMTNIPFELEGSGYVVSQNIDKGTLIYPSTEVKLKFKE